MSDAVLVLTDGSAPPSPGVRKASAGAYAASAKQSIAKIIRAVQSFLSVSSWRKAAGGADTLLANRVVGDHFRRLDGRDGNGRIVELKEKLGSRLSTMLSGEQSERDPADAT